MIIFKGTAEASMRNALEKLEKASTSHEQWVQDAAFQSATHSLVTLAVVMHRGDRPNDEDLAAFRQRVAELLDRKNNRGNLSGYLADGATLAGRALQPGAYYEAALVRTVAQLLIDDYPGVADQFDTHDRDDLADIDEALREAAEEVPPLPEAGIPEGLPDTHWWWRAPHGDPRTHELLHGSVHDL